MPTVNPSYQAHKFGGSSLANAERFLALKSLLKGQDEVIVASAVQGTTNTLQKMLDLAKSNSAFVQELNALEKTHLHILNTLLPASQNETLTSAIQKDFAALKEMLDSIQLTQACSTETQNFVLGYGEIWSAKILTAFLSQHHKALYLDASTVLFITEKNGIKCVDWTKSEAALTHFLQNKTFDQIVITGFIASTLEGHRTILGRNGSDFSGAIFAKLFKAQQLTIWTDVDGIYTADPARVRSAFVIESLSYKEALELAYFGAKVLHPQTIAPAVEANIPIYVKNSFNPAAPGTYISATPTPSAHLIKGLTSIDEISLINIEGTGMAGVSGIAARVFEILHQAGVSMILISQASSEHSICLAVANTNTDRALQALNQNLQFEIERKQIETITADQTCSILAAVGNEMVGTTGVLGKICGALAKANVNIRAIVQGASERNISLVVKNKDLNRALQAVHTGLYLSPKTISIGVIGPGVVGSTLLTQIQAEIEKLKSNYQINLCVRGILNSRQMLLRHEPIDLSTWTSQLENSPDAANVDQFVDHIRSDDFPHAVIIDCTANKSMGAHYVPFIEKGIHVITPNKHANAGDLTYYKQLKSLTQQSSHYYLYEATVCAGLPVINTIQDLLKTGDSISTIEGVVSGTLSYIFNALALGRSFSEVVLEAKKLGYTEPDPREDLSGMDVARKLVCLAREIGYDVTLDDVKVTNLVPEALRECPLPEFLEKLVQYDNQMESLLAEAKAKSERLCYVGAIDATGKIAVAIKSFPAAHAFSRLAGTDNMLILQTKRYHTNPLIIQGPGAGAEVTAAGIFADLLRLVSFLS
jgi:aspartokinase/homoserine dehydrogenase 1